MWFLLFLNRAGNMEGEDELPHYSGVILAKYLQNLDGNIASLQTSLIEARMCRAPVLSPQDVSKTLSEGSSSPRS